MNEWTTYWWGINDENSDLCGEEFFTELKEPQATLKNYINPWQGQEIDFKYRQKYGLEKMPLLMT